MNHSTTRHGLPGRSLLILLLCLFALAPAWAAHPALWTASKGDTTVYFFGSVHALPADTDWHFPALDKALDDSDALFVEIAEMDKATMMKMVRKLGLDPAHPLSEKLTEDEQALLEAAVTDAGIPGGMAAINMMKPWLAGVSLSTAAMIKAGFDPKLGVDRQIMARMKQAGVPLKGLETTREQLLMLSGMPADMQMNFLRSTLQEYSQAGTQLTKLVDAWQQGDTERLANVANKSIKELSMALYQRLLVARNENWAEQLAHWMDSSEGTATVVVGTAHLVGSGNLRAQLEERGIDVQRVPSEEAASTAGAR